MDSHRGSDAVIRNFLESQSEPSLRATWRGWAEALHRRHLDGLAAWLIESARPLSIVSAQLLFIGRPFLGAGADQLAELLESAGATDEFIDYLNAPGSTGAQTGQGDP